MTHFIKSTTPLVHFAQKKLMTFRFSFFAFLLLISQISFSQNWSALGTGMNDKVFATAVYDGFLYAGGSFTTAGGASANYLAKWNGTSWSAVGVGTNGEVDVLAVYKNELYVGGKFTKAGGSTVDYIARWDGGGWSDVQSGTDGYVTALALYGTELIVGGNFTQTDGKTNNYVVRWDGSSWISMSTGMGGTQGQVLSLAVYGTDLIAGGLFTTAGGTSASHIAKWNGTAWSALGGGINAAVYSLSSYGNDLIAGGLFTSAGSTSVNNIAKWNGTTWSALGTGTSGGTTGSVLSLYVNSSNLFVGGDFTSAGGSSANYIAKWNGSSWSSLGSGMSGSLSAYAVNTITTFNGDLIAGGIFTTAGSVSANYIAKWSAGSIINYFDAGINSIVSPKGSLCQGSTVPVKVQLKNYSNSVLDTVTISWSVNNAIQPNYLWIGSLSTGNTTNATIGNYTFSTSGITKIKAWTSNPNNLTDTIKSNDSSSTRDTVLTLPIANAGLKGSICNASSYTIGTAPQTGITYSWTSNPVGFTSKSANPLVSPLVSTTYYLTVKNTSGCSNTDTVFIRVLPIPNAIWTIVANKRSVNFNPSDSSFKTYSWDFGDGIKSSLSHPNHVFAKDSTYNVSLNVVDSNGCVGQYSHKITISSIVR